MFCPNESAISILPRQGGSKLFEYAIKNKITLASPSIFYYMLKTAEYSWKADKQNKNVSDVIQLANLVSTQAVDIYGSAKKAQEAIANTSEKVSEIMGKIKDGSGSFLSRIQRMNKLGLSPKKQIPIEVEDDDEGEIR
jgi:DNA recombination protein RmuC